MIVEDVENTIPLRGDPLAPPGFEARAMRITTSSGTFHTPARVLTRSEHMARSEVAISKALPDDLAIDFRPLTQKGVERLAGDGSAAEALIRSTRQFNSCTRRAVLRASVVQPPKISVRSMPAEEKIRLADMQADIFRTSLDAEIISYPYVGLAASDYTRFISRRARRDEACTTLFVLDMGMDPATLDKVLEHLRRDHRPAIVPLIHRGPDETALQRHRLTRYMRDEKMAFVACQVPRIGYARGRAVSNVHTASAQYGYDMVALEQHLPAPVRRAPDLNKIRFYSRSGLRIDTVRDALAQRGAGLVDEFHLNRNNERDRRHIAGMLETFEDAATDGRLFRKLAALAKVHEAINSPREFARMRDMISNRLFGEYLSQTELGRAHMRPLGDPAQTLMTDYPLA